MRRATADGQISPIDYLTTADFLLKGNAATWAEASPEMARLRALSDPTDEDVRRFKECLINKFPSQAVDTVAQSFDTEVHNLAQANGEPLHIYYNRAHALLRQFGGRDRPSTSNTNQTLSTIEEALLGTIMSAFARGLADVGSRKKVIEAITMPAQNLHGLYQYADQYRRTQIEIAKYEEELDRLSQLEFYKEVAQKSYTSSSLESMRATYRAGQPMEFPQPPESRPHVYQQTYQQQALLPPPPPPPKAYPPNDARSYPPRRPQGNQSRDSLAPPKGLPPREESRNPYIRGDREYQRSKDGLLCIRCGHLGHMARDCDSQPVPAWEASYLGALIQPVRGQSLEDNAADKFAAKRYGYWDESNGACPFGTTSGNATSSVAAPSQNVSLGSNSLSWSTHDNTPPPSCTSTTVLDQPAPVAEYISTADPYPFSSPITLDAFIGETSGPNKRAHVESPPTNPTYNQPMPFVPMQTQLPPSGVMQQPNESTRDKKKGTTRVGKVTTPNSLVGCMDDKTGVIEEPVSLREILRKTHFNISLIDYFAWSPMACTELRRLLTKAVKGKKGAVKGKRKGKATGQTPAMIPMPEFPLHPMWAQTQSAPASASPQAPVPAPIQTFAGQPPQAYMQQAPVPQTSTNPLKNPTIVPSSHIAAVPADGHTKFLRTLLESERAYRIPASIRIFKENKLLEYSLDKAVVQADQGSEMNLVSMEFVRRYNIPLHPLADMGFAGLSMRCADHRETPMKYFIDLQVGVQNIWRETRAFVAPEQTGSVVSQPISLLLGLPWLWAVDARFGIRQSRIDVGDVSKGETVRSVIGPELVFCRDHNLILYPKEVLLQETPSEKPRVTFAEEEDEDEDEEGDEEDEEDDGDEKDSDTESEDALSDIDEDRPAPKQDF